MKRKERVYGELRHMKDIWGIDNGLVSSLYYCYYLNSITAGIFEKPSLCDFL